MPRTPSRSQPNARGVSSPSVSLAGGLVSPRPREDSPFIDYVEHTAQSSRSLGLDDPPALEEASDDDDELDDHPEASNIAVFERPGRAPSPSRSPSLGWYPSSSPPSTPRLGPQGRGEPFEPPRSAREMVQQSCSVWFFRPLLLLVAFLHIEYRLSHRASALLLSAVILICKSLGILDGSEDTPQTLKTAFKRLHLEDRFSIAPMCPRCRRIYSAESDPDRKCDRCSVSLFRDNTFPALAPAPLSVDWQTKAPPKCSAKPAMQTPMRLPSELIADLINSTPSMENELDKWRDEPPFDGKNLRRVQDGEIWRTVPGPDKLPFFANSQATRRPPELRIGVTLGFDGFGFAKSAFAESHSTGALSLCVQNLEPHLRYRPENLLLCGLTPGPSELNADELQFFMKAFVDDLLMLYERGIKAAACGFF
ncbi:hypothetical protein PsYK624_168910 [Phanerochaete sordida]|uniref:Uncharacterized protein n=1 Tax=Phanerochaete sordida TaxID=48140 RepID=A0A9P3GSB5_9APHY|nr:hypothetical protein PsYK624_168910 [Phanerochaete sordida]